MLVATYFLGSDVVGSGRPSVMSLAVAYLFESDCFSLTFHGILIAKSADDFSNLERLRFSSR